MVAGFQVSVRLTTADGQPIQGADLTLKNSLGYRLSITGRRGRGGANVYSLGNLAPGQYTLEARWDDQEGAAGFNVQGEGTIPITLK
jgi:hypothetical protein